jgi:hypothetical protein
MTNISQSPRSDSSAHDMAPLKLQATPRDNAEGRGVLSNLVKVVWVATALVWPAMKWVLSFDVLFQFFRMLYHWSTPGAYATWTFFLHFSVLVLLTGFVSLYKPRGI